MKKIIRQKQLFKTSRWKNFLDSVAAALQVNLSLVTSDSKFTFSTPGFCPLCHQEFPVLAPSGLQEFSANKDWGIIECSNGEVNIICLHPDYHVAVQVCPFCGNGQDPPLSERSEIASKLLCNFLTSLDSELEGGQRNVELSTLRQMNSIVLSLFRGDGSAMDLASNLILSSLILLLEAKGSWLDYEKGKETIFVVKGDQSGVEKFLQTGKGRGTSVKVVNGFVRGTLGVLEPSDYRADAVLSLMADECAIVFEIEHLFELLEKRLTSVLGAINSGILLINQHKNITYVNTYARKLLGHPFTTLVGSQIDAVPGPWVPFIARNHKYSVSGFMDSLNRGENNRFFDWQVNPLTENGATAGWVVIFNDRTDFYRWQRATREAERMETMAALVGSLAHELRNPLHAASGLVQLMSRTPNPEKIHGYSDLILREIERITGLLNEFLLLGRPSDLCSNPIDPVDFIREVFPLLEGEASFYEAQIKFSYETTQKIMADSGQMTQVLLNLVRNAMQAAGTGGLVEINLKNGSGFVTLEVKDNGPGIPHDFHERVFQPFFTTKERGTGLGLPIVQAIVQNHGGKISAHNSPETGGAVFSIDLPSATFLDETQTVLDVFVLIEDKYLNKSCEQAIRNAGLSVSSAPDIHTAISLSCHFYPRIILLDQVFSAQQELQTLKKPWPMVKTLLFLSKGDTPVENVFEILEYPFDMTQLLNKINLMLNYYHGKIV